MKKKTLVEEKKKRWFKIYSVGRQRELVSVIHCKTKPLTHRLYLKLVKDEMRKYKNSFVEFDPLTWSLQGKQK